MILIQGGGSDVLFQKYVSPTYDECAKPNKARLHD